MANSSNTNNGLEQVFVKSLVTEHVKLKPLELGNNYKEVLLQKLRGSLEGKCTRHGYVRSGSVRLYKVSSGAIADLQLNGDVTYTVLTYIDVCNPSVGSIVRARVVNTNRFGILAHCGLQGPNGDFTPVLEIIVAKNGMTAVASTTVDVESVRVGDTLDVEIMGKRFEIRDTKISSVGRIVRHMPRTSSYHVEQEAVAIAPVMDDNVDAVYEDSMKPIDADSDAIVEDADDEDDDAEDDGTETISDDDVDALQEVASDSDAQSSKAIDDDDTFQFIDSDDGGESVALKGMDGLGDIDGDGGDIVVPSRRNKRKGNKASVTTKGGGGNASGTMAYYNDDDECFAAGEYSDGAYEGSIYDDVVGNLDDD